MILSIIIPAYNAEAHIEFCLLSCYQQDLKLTDYEIILVNDGSTDATEEKAITFAKKYFNLKIITQLNKGHGAARNTGVELAQGDYIYFLDADDYLAKNTLGALIRLLQKHNLDVLGFKSKNVANSYSTESKTSQSEILSEPILNGIEYLAQHNYKSQVWWYITKRSFYTEQKFLFYDKKFVQDSFFTSTVICHAKRILVVNSDVHRYRQSQNSITRTKTPEHIENHLNDICFAIQKFYELRQNLIAEGITNTKALNRIQAKQQHYVFIAILRFMQSTIAPSKLQTMLSDFNSAKAYPMDVYRSTLTRKTPLNLVLCFIFNTKILLYPSIHSYRIYKSLKQKFRRISLI